MRPEIEGSLSLARKHVAAAFGVPKACLPDDDPRAWTEFFAWNARFVRKRPGAKHLAKAEKHLQRARFLQSRSHVR